MKAATALIEKLGGSIVGKERDSCYSMWVQLIIFLFNFYYRLISTGHNPFVKEKNKILQFFFTNRHDPQNIEDHL